MLLDSNGTVLDGLGDLAADAAAPTAPDGRPFDLPRSISGSREPLRGVWLRVGNGTGLRVLVAASRKDLDSDASFLKRALCIVFGLAVAWTTLLSGWVVYRLTRPHRRIVEIAQRAAAGDLSARVGLPGGSDDLAELGRNMDEMVDRLAVSVDSQQQFIAHAAHELRSPLTTLYAELTNALRRDRSREEYRDAIEAALVSTRRLKLLAEDLLSLARLGADRSAAAGATSVLNALAEACEAVEVDRHARNVSWQIEGADVWVAGRLQEIARLFRNLLENAVRHSPAGAIVRVSVSDERPDICQVSVANDGPGIAEVDRERIFQPFFRDAATRADQRHPGAGLGLTIAREIARLSGGDLDLEARVSGETCFRVSLLKARDRPRASEAEPARSPQLWRTREEGRRW